MFNLYFLISISFLLLFNTIIEYKPALQDETPTTPDPGEITILSPNEGQAIQGKVPIICHTDVAEFKSSELNFSYTNDPTNTWFHIVESDIPVNKERIIWWDTNTISDGDYDLQLIVTMMDGRQEFTIIRGVRVRNYSPIEMETPTPVSQTPTVKTSSTPVATLTPFSTNTPMHFPPSQIPGNPVILTRSDVLISAGKGVLVAIGLFALGGLYVSVRSFRKKE